MVFEASDGKPGHQTASFILTKICWTWIQTLEFSLRSYSDQAQNTSRADPTCCFTFSNIVQPISRVTSKHPKTAWRSFTPQIFGNGECQLISRAWCRSLLQVSSDGLSVGTNVSQAISLVRKTLRSQCVFFKWTYPNIGAALERQLQVHPGTSFVTELG
jgi:hypothetical protein